VHEYDTAICGMGGGIAMPDGKASKGNVATEEVVRFVERLGYDTGVDLDSVREIAAETGERIGRPPDSAIHRTGTVEEAFERYGVEE
jgi:hydroxymethylglutaryl-CoA lyase